MEDDANLATAMVEDANPETLRGGFQRRMLEHYEDAPLEVSQRPSHK